MTVFFLKLLNMSIAASWMVLVIIFLRLILKKAPKAWHCVLWAMVAIRLIIPVFLESPLSLIPSVETVSPEILYSPAPEIQTGIPAVNNAVNPVIAEAYALTVGESVNPVQMIAEVAAYIWTIGVTALLLYACISVIRIRRKVRTAIWLAGDIWQSEQVESPFILGIIRPRIYLPFHIDKTQIVHVIAHERAHLSRRDHWWKPLGFLLLAVYWFNPLSWVAYTLLCQDMELACDEKVIKNMDVQGKRAYSVALLTCSAPRHMIAACPLAFGEVGVKKRIIAVLKYKKPASWIIAAAVIASVVVAVCFLTSPENAAPQRTTKQGELVVGAVAETTLPQHDPARFDPNEIQASMDDETNAQSSPEDARTFTGIMGFDGYMEAEPSGSWELRTYHTVIDGTPYVIAESFGFGGIQDYTVDLDGDGVTELVANVQFGGDGAQRAYVYQRKGNDVYLGTLSVKDLPNFDNWGANATQSEYDPATGVFRLRYAQKGSEDYATLEMTTLDRFEFSLFRTIAPEDEDSLDRE